MHQHASSMGCSGWVLSLNFKLHWLSRQLFHDQIFMIFTYNIRNGDSHSQKSKINLSLKFLSSSAFTDFPNLTTLEALNFFFKPPLLFLLFTACCSLFPSTTWCLPDPWSNVTKDQLSVTLTPASSKYPWHSTGHFSSVAPGTLLLL